MGHPRRVAVFPAGDSLDGDPGEKVRDGRDEQIEDRDADGGVEKQVQKVVVAGVVADLVRTFRDGKPDLQFRNDAQKEIQHVYERRPNHLFRHVVEPDFPRSAMRVFMVSLPNKRPYCQYPHYTLDGQAHRPE